MIIIKKYLNSFQLKIIALITMTIDHYGYFIKPDVEIYRIIGRISFVIFAYFCANAYLYTSNKKKYALNLLIFGAIIDIILLISNNYVTSNIFITLGLGFILIDSIVLKKYLRIIIVLIVPVFIDIDYGYYGLLFIVASYIFHKKITYLLISNILLILLFNFIDGLSLIQLYSVFGVTLLYLYNEQRGPKVKYLFYIYYPVHIIILNLLLLI